MSETATLQPAARERLPDRREHVLIDFTTTDGFRYTAGLGYFEDGRLAEIFLNADKIGTAIETAARDSAVVASLALQHGVPPDTIRHALSRNGNGDASGPLGALLDLLASAAIRWTSRGNTPQTTKMRPNLSIAVAYDGRGKRVGCFSSGTSAAVKGSNTVKP
jgi:hypothetical protein